MNRANYVRFAWFTLLFMLFVIIWGGYVSASGSGAGCGDSWPHCPAFLNPTGAEEDPKRFATFVELFHRLTSGLSLIFVILLWLGARRFYPPQHETRRMAWWTFFFIVVESLLGAGLVLFQWVETNESLFRAIVQPIHLINTNVLLGVLLYTVWFARGGKAMIWRGKTAMMLIGILLGWLALSSFGSIASLASTIFPSESFLQGLAKDFTGDSHYLIRLRILHPLLAIVVGAAIWRVMAEVERKYPHHSRLTSIIPLLFVVQFALGGVNAIMLAPIGVQLLHLLLADGLWLLLLWLSAQILSSSVEG